MNILPIIIAIGTYTVNTGSQGVYLVKLDIDNKTSSIIQTIPAQNPSFLQYVDKTSTLYYVEELENLKGTINAAKLDETKEQYQKVSSFPTQGSSPCHIAISPDKGTLTASNYSSGNFTTFALQKDGSIEKELANHKFDAKSIHPSRQKRSHIHSAFYSADSKKVFVQDLGGDNIYQFDAKNIGNPNGTYKTHQITKGAGPRHIAFSSDNKYVYVINELNGKIDVFTLDKNTEIKTLIQSIDLNQKNDPGQEDHSAHILISKDGKFLYASTRAEMNNISVYAIGDNGQLTLKQIVKSEGKGPRHFDITPDGNWLLVANQYTNSVNLFAIDRKQGTLTNSTVKIDIPSPVCVTIIK